MMDGAPWDYGIELFQEQTDRIEHELTLGFERYPVCRRWASDLGQRRLHLLARRQPAGRAGAGKRGYWSACAVMAGFLQGGGVGKTLAEWMIHGEPEADAWHGCRALRRWAENKRVYQARPRASSIPAAS
jgi:dimethylglycine dehydrogenase